MALKTEAPRGKKKKTQVVVAKAMEKMKTCRRLPNPTLATPGRSLALGIHMKKQVSTSVKAMLHFPVGRIGRYIKEYWYSQRIGFGAPVYLPTVVKYLTAEVLELARKAMKDSKKIHMLPRHVILIVMRDEELSKLLDNVTIMHDGVLPNIHESLLGNGTAKDASKLPAEDAAKSPDKTVESP